MKKETYKKDSTLPVQGRRSMAENAGCVRIRMEKTPYAHVYTTQLYLNIDTNAMVYNIRVDDESRLFGKKIITDAQLSQDLLKKLVEMAENEELLTLKNMEVFPKYVTLDGDTINISIKSDKVNISLNDGTLAKTLVNGVIETCTGEIKTPLHRLWKAGLKSINKTINFTDEQKED
ncbi:MAG: hypothetical protein J6T18_04330 [Bacteroidaceae bacterium]|nr:hypothetical protein [Bacteroidaceae bacterium]MBO7588632.1 hypothetical protein [Bacteroidaceae bacterium]